MEEIEAKVEAIIGILYPGRDISDAERNLVLRWVGKMCGVRQKRPMLPLRDVPLGDTVVIRGEEFECVPVPRDIHFSEACSGCDLSHGPTRCGSVLCSAFDRKDRRFVWYVKK